MGGDARQARMSLERVRRDHCRPIPVPMRSPSPSPPAPSSLSLLAKVLANTRIGGKVTPLCVSRRTAPRVKGFPRTPALHATRATCGTGDAKVLVRDGSARATPRAASGGQRGNDGKETQVRDLLGVQRLRQDAHCDLQQVS